MNKNEALKMAIEALELAQIDANIEFNCGNIYEKEINACKEALEQQEIGDAEIKQMLDDIEYYQKRVEALEQPLTRDWKETIDERIARDSEFKESIEQPEGKEFFERGKEISRWADKQAQEPVAWMYQREDGAGVLNFERNFALMDKGYKETALYTHPHQWQGLTELEQWNLINKSDIPADYDHELRAIEQALKEKNT